MGIQRLLLATDYRLCREGLRALLDGIDGLRVVGEARDGREAVARASRLRPHVVVLDAAIPGLSVADVAADLLRISPGPRIVMVADRGDVDSVARLVAAGAAAVVLKCAPPGDLVQAIAEGRAGTPFFCRCISARVVSECRRQLASGQIERDPLTRRQREVLQLLVEGRSTKEAAGVLRISVKTAESHRAQLLDRLQIHDLPSLVRYAIRRGLTRL